MNRRNNMQKTNFKTRLLALLTAAFMIVMCVPFAAFADDAVMTINYYVDNQPVGSDSFKQEYDAWALRNAFEDDSVIPEGKELTGWVPLGHSEVTLKPGTNYSWDELSQYAQGGTLTLDAVFEAPKPAAPKKHFNVTFTVDSNKGSFTDYGAGPVEVKGNEDEAGDQQFDIPAVTAKEGYKFVGWKGQGASEIAWGADAKTFGVSGLCFYDKDSTEGFASIEAVFEEDKTEPEQPAAPKKHFNVTFTVAPDKGSFTEYGAGPVEFKGNEDEVGDQQYNIPAVTAKPGYKFVGWKGQGASEIAWDADAKTFGVSGLCFYQNGSNEGFASVEAVFEPTVKLTDIKVNFLKEDGKTVVSAAQYIAKDATLVLPYDVEGVIGWKLANNLTTYDVKTKFSFNDLAAFVGTNYAADGTANLTFYAQYKTEVELKNITIKYVEDKDGAQEDVAAPQNNFTAKDEFTILTDSLYNGKVPAGKKLIGWQYKNGGKTTNFVKGEHVKFDTLKALLNGNWDNEGNAWVTLTPVFQDVKSDNGNSSSGSSSNSSSSASSASNTTNTSASQKQVVKAAAAPANTTKVLPKTGATNAAPLIGGSLAVVALLMGYGVYGLVLRKKD